MIWTGKKSVGKPALNLTTVKFSAGPAKVVLADLIRTGTNKSVSTAAGVCLFSSSEFRVGWAHARYTMGIKWNSRRPTPLRGEEPRTSIVNQEISNVPCPLKALG
jgi:hypothetical protein